MPRRKAKSWVPVAGPIENWEAGFGLSIPRAKLGLRLFLAIVTVLFFLLVVAYVIRMGIADWKRLPEPGILWVNTIVLIGSSTAFHWAKRSVKRNQIGNAMFSLQFAGGFSWAFLGGQLFAWKELNSMGYLITTNPANSFFYLITAIHGFHLLGGLVAWRKTTRKVTRWGTVTGKILRQEQAEKVRLNVDLCTLYWDFLLLIWCVVFAVMLVT